jgi:hypothetical protein
MVHATALYDLRRRGQFVVGALCSAAAAGFLFAAAGSLLVFYHYGLALAERLRLSLGFRPPQPGAPDWYLLAAMALPVAASLAAIFAGWAWYRRTWARRLYETWGGTSKHSRWSAHRQEYLTALCATPAWSNLKEPRPELILEHIERDIVERAFTTGLVVGVSTHRLFDLIAIFAAALELQLHVLTRLGKRPSLAVWTLLIQRCGASLFVNHYLTRQDALLLNLAVKKAGLGLHAAGDAMDSAAQHLTSHDLDLDDLLHLNKLDGVPLAGLATKGLEVAATMTLTVGKQGLHALGHLVENAGDELATGAVAAAILYYHGMALAADALALDATHRSSPAMNRGFAEGLQRMASMAGAILLDCVRQRRAAFRDVRMAAVKQLPKMAGSGIRDKVAGWFS